MKPLLRYFSCVLRVIVWLEGKPSAQSKVLSTLEGQDQGFFICHIIVIQGIIRSEM